MLFPITSFNLKRLIIYTIALSIAALYLNYTKKQLSVEHQCHANIECYDLSDPDEFIRSFITIKSEDKNYENLLRAEKLFDQTFPEASANQKALFKIYYLASLSSEHPDLYEKLRLLENSLNNINAMIKSNPRSYNLRVARVNLHNSLPIYFRNSDLIKIDIKFLINGFNNTEEFEFTVGSRRLSIEDFRCILDPLKRYNLIGSLNGFSGNDGASPLV